MINIGELKDVDLAPMLQSGNFLIDGRLNQTFKRGKKTYHQLPFEAPGRHSIACIDGKIVDSAYLKDYPGHKLSASVLHLKKGTGTPDKKMGFFRDIRKVYRVWACEVPHATPPCTAPGGECCK